MAERTGNVQISPPGPRAARLPHSRGHEEASSFIVSFHRVQMTDGVSTGHPGHRVLGELLRVVKSGWDLIREASSSPEARTIKGKQGLSYARYPAGVRSCFPWNESPVPSHPGSHSSSTSALAFEPGEKSRAHKEVLLWEKWRLETVYIISCSAEILGLRFH